MPDRDWLFTQYVIGQRSLADIAAEFGTSYVHMFRLAKRHRIPIRQRWRTAGSCSQTLLPQR